MALKETEDKRMRKHGSCLHQTQIQLFDGAENVDCRGSWGKKKVLV